MRGLILILALSIGQISICQTVSIEFDQLSRNLKDKGLSSFDQQERARAWQQIKPIYPVLPYDTVTHEFNFERVITFPGVTKNEAFKRVKEWGAIMFGNLDSTFKYEDLADGKIIFEGYSEISYLTTKQFLFKRKIAPDNIDLFFILVVYVKDGKAKLNFKNVRFRNENIATLIGETFIPSVEYYIPFHQLFPIVDNAPELWNPYVEMINKAVNQINVTFLSMERYIRDAATDGNF